MTQPTVLKLLVVDDEVAICSAIERATRDLVDHVEGIESELHFEATLVHDGETALQHLAKGGFDIVLVDYKLPGISGLDILKYVMDHSVDVVMVMMTAYASIETAIQATRLGAYDFLAKPFTLDELRYSLHKTAQHVMLKKKAAALAEEKKQIRFQFTSVLAHELKSPLGAVEGYMRIMKDRIAGDSLDAYGDAIDRSLVRLDGMRKLIYDLLELTRLESGQKNRSLASIDLTAIARQSMESVQPDADLKGIQIKLESPEVLEMHGDKSELEMILNNLLTNAVKYNQEKGAVTLTLSQEDGAVVIACQDTGIGMTKAEVAMLFGEFVRIKNDRTSGIPGSGLGLSILQKIAGLYGGAVSVRSVPAKGSTFTVRLPQGADRT